MVRALLCQAVSLYILLVFLRVVLSWFPIDPRGPVGQVARVVVMATDPVLTPVRRYLPATGGFDLSPIIVWFFLQFVVQRALLGC
jgi:YggT family protein